MMNRATARLLIAGAVILLGDEACRAAPPAHSAYLPALHLQPNTPHPAVARIIVEEGGATAYGSGTLVDVRDQFGLVVTNWHVVRDRTGDVEVLFPDGFRSKARPLKIDEDWDLAALVIWRPPAPPAAIAQRAPQPGDRLTICGYGQGQYRAATGRCTKYYAPKLDLPQHMVELDVEARQGDSGGPIFNDRGELAGVLFGAGGGTTLGSFGGRVQSFLVSLAPDIGQGASEAFVENDSPPAPDRRIAAATPDADDESVEPQSLPERIEPSPSELASAWATADREPRAVNHADWQSDPAASAPPGNATQSAQLTSDGDSFELAKSVLAVVGAIALLMQVVRFAR